MRCAVLIFRERYNVAIVMKATYGRDIESTRDELVLKTEEAGRVLTGVDAPGASLVDLIPSCEWNRLTCNCDRLTIN